MDQRQAQRLLVEGPGPGQIGRAREGDDIAGPEHVKLPSRPLDGGHDDIG